MSSKHHKHHRSSSRSETKKMSVSRKIVAFFLFVSLLVLSSSACVKAVVLNPNEIATALTSSEYTNALYLDAQQYSYDMCDKCSVPREIVDDAINFSSVKEINDAYIIGNITKSEGFTASTYSDKLDELNENMAQSLSAKLQKNNINASDAQIKEFSQNINDYLRKIVEIEYISKLKAVTNVGTVGLIVMIVTSAIFVLIFAGSILSIGKKLYRKIRTISFSFIATGIVDFILVLGVEIVKKTKELYIFPTYLCDAAMRYVEDSKNVFVGAGMAAFVVAIILVTIAWKLKRDDK